jgi:hypothetical protein
LEMMCPSSLTCSRTPRDLWQSINLLRVYGVWFRWQVRSWTWVFVRHVITFPMQGTQPKQGLGPSQRTVAPQNRVRPTTYCWRNNRDVAQKPHRPHAAFGHCARPLYRLF